LSGSAVQVKGFGSSLCSSRKRLMAAWRSTTERNTPRCRFAGRLLQRQGDDPFRYALAKRRNAGRAGLVAKKAVEAFLHEAFLPAPDASLGLAGPAHDLVRPETVRGKQDDLGPPRMLLRGVAILDDRLELRSADETVMEIPVRMPQTRTRDPAPESPARFVRFPKGLRRTSRQAAHAQKRARAAGPSDHRRSRYRRPTSTNAPSSWRRRVRPTFRHAP
jgi:hypothetical protein